MPQYRARLVRNVLSQDSDVLFGCERRESLNKRTRTPIANAHEVLVRLSLGGCQDYNKGQNIPRITAVTNARAKMYEPIFAPGATTSRSLSNASVAASSSKMRMRRSVCDRRPGLAATRSQKYVPRDSALWIPPHAIFLKQRSIFHKTRITFGDLCPVLRRQCSGALEICLWSLGYIKLP